MNVQQNLSSEFNPFFDAAGATLKEQWAAVKSPWGPVSRCEARLILESPAGGLTYCSCYWLMGETGDSGGHTDTGRNMQTPQKKGPHGLGIL